MSLQASPTTASSQSNQSKQSKRPKPKVIAQNIFELLRRSLEKFNIDRVPQMAGAFAYLMLFSLAPLLFIVIAIVGAVMGEFIARQQVFQFVQSIVGADSARFVDSLITGIARPGAGLLATILGLVAVFLGAIGIFGQVKFALRIIWNVPALPPKGGLHDILYFVRDQLASGLLVIGTGLLMLASLIFSVITTAVVGEANNLVNGLSTLWQPLNTVLSFVVLTFIFGAAYRYLPGMKIHWSDVLPGAIVTSLLFALGRWLVSLYLGQTSATSAYGAAGSLVLFLLWVNYIGQILFFGAEVTAVYTSMFGSLRGTHKAEEIATDMQPMENRTQVPVDPPPPTPPPKAT